jgi:hypothetical protein
LGDESEYCSHRKSDIRNGSEDLTTSFIDSCEIWRAAKRQNPNGGVTIKIFIIYKNLLTKNFGIIWLNYEDHLRIS